MVIIMLENCNIGDIVKITWVDIGANHEFYPLMYINDMITEIKAGCTMTTYGEIVYLKDNDIGVTYTRTKKDVRLIYLRQELIESIEVLEPRKLLEHHQD